MIVGQASSLLLRVLLLAGAIAAVVLASGIMLAVWARVHLGRNWGMPMSQKADAELVTSGPYRFVRHPTCPRPVVITGRSSCR